MTASEIREHTANPSFTDVVDKLAGGYKTIGQMVYAVLKEAILSGAFVPGEWLRQESLATAIGVSRIPVRTALMQLESEGLVSFHPHRGARVRIMTPEQINEIYRLRALLEPYALRRIMTRLTPDRVNVLRDLAAQLDSQPEGSQFLDARVRLYRELYDADSNPLLVQMIEDLRSHLGRYLLGFRLSGDHRHQHTELIDHLSARDRKAAEAWLHRHLEDVRQGLEAIARDDRNDAVDDAPLRPPLRPPVRKRGR
ncbi:MAG: GntR family transcriptional regulator [Streptosporangiaceae bacterium]